VTVSAPNAQRRPIRALTSIRGLAAWWVVLYHVQEFLPPAAPDMLQSVLAHGYLAVDLFFMLSGFVISLNYAGHFARLEAGQLRRFLLLRLGRIYPLHLVMLIAFLANPIAIGLFSATGQPGERYAVDYFLLSLLLMQNWGFTHGLAWNIPAWSISTEWFAYLVFPPLAWASLRWARDAVGALWLAVLLLLVLAAICAIIGGGLGDRIETFGLVRCVLEFAIGVFLQRLHAARPMPVRWEGQLALAAALGCFAAFAFLPIPDWLVMPLGFALLIHALVCGGHILSAGLDWVPLERIGEISYSTYLCHYMLKDWTKFLFIHPGTPLGPVLLGYLVAVALASILLYRWVEVPGRALSRRLVGPLRPELAVARP
jgi:peptidoglycan/LPS O-acetylase OafA/YrhL